MGDRGAGRRFLTVTVSAVLAVTSLPYAYAYLSAPDDRRFMGVLLDVPDHVVYLSWMRELTHLILVSNKMTPEPNAPIFFNLLWFVMGRLGHLTGLGPAGALQALRIAAGAAFLVALYRVCGRLVEDPLVRRTAFLVAVLASGFGWVLVVMKYTVTGSRLLFPLDVFIAEGNTFLMLMAYPHFVLAALYILVFELVLRSRETGRRRHVVAAGGIALATGLHHAYDLLSVYGVLGAYTGLVAVRDRCVPWELVRAGTLIGAISCWPALYAAALTTWSPTWREGLAQFDNAGVFTPSPPHLVVLLGPALVLALVGFFRERPLRLAGLPDRELLLRAWFLAGFILVYLPVDYRVHLINGWQVPISILATRAVLHDAAPAVARIAARFRGRSAMLASPRALALALILVVLPTNVYLWVWRFVDLGRHESPYYLHRDELAALEWLEAQGTGEDAVMASLTIGQWVPATTGKHAFVAHWAMTRDYYGKRAMVDAFYAAETSDTTRQAILNRYAIDYVFHGPAERALGAYRPDDSPFLTLRFERPRVRVYAVRATSG